MSITLTYDKFSTGKEHPYSDATECDHATFF